MIHISSAKLHQQSYWVLDLLLGINKGVDVFAYLTSANVLGSSCVSVTVGFPAFKPVKGVLPQTCTLVVGGLIEI